MINPQRYSKTLGNKKLRLGVSVEELVVCSFIPFGLSFLDIEFFFGMLAFVGSITALVIKNRFMRVNQIQDSFNKRPYIKWERVAIDD